MEDIISVENLNKSYGTLKAVDGLSFSAARGGLFAFLGENGAGKSTTINILSGILKKDSGKVVLNGKDIDKDPDGIKNDIGVVFQTPRLDGLLSVKDNLAVRASLYFGKAEAAARVLKTAEELEIQDILKQAYKTLSGGQKRRADIARALLSDPKILFLDEPTTGLDPKTRELVWNIIRRKKDGGTTVFLTTHYMREVEGADKVVIIDKGKKAAEGSPDALRSEFARDYARIVTPKNAWTEAALNSAGIDFDYRENAYFARFKSTADALEFVWTHKAEIADFEILKGGMDDVFLNVTGRMPEDAART
ncbi:MAG: ABC transporter ATP-binding protein [Clostridiales bacterium]|jgi:multidrug/hemolysin transport system ATP-binding protein|nr:ABC transporter ATP-binding protein [Clostridiales bacterium]